MCGCAESISTKRKASKKEIGKKKENIRKRKNRISCQKRRKRKKTIDSFIHAKYPERKERNFVINNMFGLMADILGFGAAKRRLGEKKGHSFCRLYVRIFPILNILSITSGQVSVAYRLAATDVY